MITQLGTLLLAATTMAAPVTKWTAAPPFPLPAGATDTILQDVTAVGPDEVWFAGSWRDSGGTLHPLTARWDGAAGLLRVALDAPGIAAPGQALVLYDGERVLGGGFLRGGAGAAVDSGASAA